MWLRAACDSTSRSGYCLGEHCLCIMEFSAALCPGKLAYVSVGKRGGCGNKTGRNRMNRFGPRLIFFLILQFCIGEGKTNKHVFLHVRRADRACEKGAECEWVLYLGRGCHRLFLGRPYIIPCLWSQQRHLTPHLPVFRWHSSLLPSAAKEMVLGWNPDGAGPAYSEIPLKSPPAWAQQQVGCYMKWIRLQISWLKLKIMKARHLELFKSIYILLCVYVQRVCQRPHTLLESVLFINHMSPGRHTGALVCWVISPASTVFVLIEALSVHIKLSILSVGQVFPLIVGLFVGLLTIFHSYCIVWFYSWWNKNWKPKGRGLEDWKSELLWATEWKSVSNSRKISSKFNSY